MRDIRFLLKPGYASSWALIIGINEYQHVSPLSYAVSDAEAVRDMLIGTLGFPESNVVCLLDADANKQNIQRAFLRYCKDDIQLDDRIFVFFAGHGHTKTGFRGEVGYLVPYDAHPDDLSTFIRWNELTSNAELIRAKHMLFIMDSCYGGLALTRNAHPGSVRFLKDMTQRYSRQVLTAGKADEVVADAGGPLPNHSVFTGHLLQGLAGAAANAHGVLTASGLMAYVYNKVASDRNSNQTPHYGHFDGDGDLVLVASGLFEKPDESKTEQDEIFVVPMPEDEGTRDSSESKVAKVKRLLSDETAAIELHDVLVKEVQHFLAASTEDNFKTDGAYSKDELIDRISKYESITGDLCAVQACLAYWGKSQHEQIMQKIFARSMDRLESQGGLNIWVNLRWYPIILQAYGAGISAVAGRRYDQLSNIFFTKVPSVDYRSKEDYLIQSLSRAILDLTRNDVFKQLPGRERNYTPMSEHLLKLLQPPLDNVLFLGRGYEAAFDEFEVMLGLVAADMEKRESGHLWGPIGRFGYKFRNSDSGGPLGRLISTAKSQGAKWAPLQSGMFGGSPDRFVEVADEYATTISRMGWM